MTMLLYVLLVTVLVLYAAGFLYETYMSFRRLKSSAREVYPAASWEIIHTTLVLAFATFMITHGPMLEAIAPLIAMPFLIALLGFFLRGACQLLIFYGRKESYRRNWLDWCFAVSHLVILVPFLYAVVVVAIYLFTHPLDVITSMFSWFIPGLIIGLVVCAWPLITVLKRSYTNR